MPLIPFPNVPNVPGVPAIARSLTVPSVGSLVNLALSGLAQAIFGQSVWGIFSADGGQPFVPDSFLGVEHKDSSRVSNYPIEAGGFASYNKVQMPFDCRVRVAISSDLVFRQVMLRQLQAMKASTDKFNVVTPEVTYLNATLQEYSYRREQTNGVTLIKVDLWFVEVRETAIALFSGTQNPSGTDPVSGGQVQSFPVDGPGAQPGTILSAETTVIQ